MITRVVVIRHCQAEGNLNKTFQGKFDCDISKGGKEQLQKLKKRMESFYSEYANLNIDKISAFYSSPLTRAKKTAQALMEQNQQLNIVENLKEIDVGVLEGTSWETFPTNFPYESDCWYNKPYLFAPENGEKMVDLYTRIYSAVENIAKQNKGKTIACVSHGCAIRNLVCRCKNLPIEKLGEVELCRNTAITVIEFDDDFNPCVIVENDYKHLGEVGISIECKLA